MELTYGGREHEPAEEAIQLLAEIVRETAFAQGGPAHPRLRHRSDPGDRLVPRSTADGWADPGAAALPGLAHGLAGERHLPTAIRGTTTRRPSAAAGRRDAARLPRCAGHLRPKGSRRHRGRAAPLDDRGLERHAHRGRIVNHVRSSSTTRWPASLRRATRAKGPSGPTGRRAWGAPRRYRAGGGVAGCDRSAGLSARGRVGAGRSGGAISRRTIAAQSVPRPRGPRASTPGCRRYAPWAFMKSRPACASRLKLPTLWDWQRAPDAGTSDQRRHGASCQQALDKVGLVRIHCCADPLAVLQLDGEVMMRLVDERSEQTPLQEVDT